MEKEKELEELRLENAKLRAELDDRQEFDFKAKQMQMLQEIKDMLRRMEYQKDLKEVEDREKDLDEQMKHLEFDIKCNAERKANIQSEYWNKR